MDTQTFRSQVRCQYDGTYERYHVKGNRSGIGECVECESYRRRVATGLVVGEDNRTEAQKLALTPAKKLAGYTAEIEQNKEVDRMKAQQRRKTAK
jgi:hypothetical protein